MDDHKVINYLKGLVIDGVHQAKSGHPGGAMSSMDYAYILFSEFLKFDSHNPQWQGRDRFVLSAGHESMLLYSLFYASGMLEESDLRQFRQLHSKTPGHPEVHLTPGVECTTGPLGQGCAMSVGFSVASQILNATFESSLFDTTTYVLLGDGCMQEDVTLGAASLAGHWQLSNLIWYYDKNAQQISGSIARATSDDEIKIFEGFGFFVQEIDGHDHAQIRDAIKQAKASKKPSLIVGKTTMAHGCATLENSCGTHGAPLPAEERTATKKKLGIPDGSEFFFPKEAKEYFQRNFSKNLKTAKDWEENLKLLLKDSKKENLYKQFFKPNFKALPEISWDTKDEATRNAFGKILEEYALLLPNLVGGSADLEPSNMTEAFFKKVGDFQKDFRKGRNFAFGVREFPMSAIANGIALYGGFKVFDATFLSFSDYSRPALRLGALQDAPVIHEFTHDSFYLGEDGPTHQPVEHAMALRLIPKLRVVRPCDNLETELYFKAALDWKEPSCFCLTRQKLPQLSTDSIKRAQSLRGAWIVKDAKNCDLIIFATGSEVGLALESAKLFESKYTSKTVRVVSVPCFEVFFDQGKDFIDEIMSYDCKNRVSIEAGVTLGWQRFTGMNGLNIGIDHFGDSAKAEDLAKEYGFTPLDVLKKIEEQFEVKNS